METITVDGRTALLDIPESEHGSHSSKMLAEALAKILIKSGMLANGALLTGPHLLQFAEELVEHSQPAGTIVGTIHYESSKNGIRFAKIYGEQPFDFEANIAIMPDDENATDDQITGALKPFWDQHVIVTLENSPNGKFDQIAKISGIKLAEKE